LRSIGPNAKAELKERARTTQESTSAIVTHATAGLSSAAKGQIAKLSSTEFYFSDSVHSTAPYTYY